MRAFRGFSTITQNNSRGWVTTHILALSVNRRFANGFSGPLTQGVSRSFQVTGRNSGNDSLNVTVRDILLLVGDVLELGVHGLDVLVDLDGFGVLALALEI